MKYYLTCCLLVLVLACSKESMDESFLTTITLSLPNTRLTLGETTNVQVSAKAYDQNGEEMSGLSFTWASSDPNKAEVDAAGKLTLLMAGTVTITASVGSVSGSVDVEIVKPSAPTANSVLLDDIGNNGNAADFRVIFKKASKEALLSEYRIIITKSSKSLSLAEANSIGNERYVAVPKANKDIKITLPETLPDSDGDLIVQGGDYKAFVLSIADGTLALDNSVSAGSMVTKLDLTTIKITFVGDDGVVITDGIKTVLVDALLARFDIWIPASPSIIADIQSGSPPYDDVSINIITHDHFDHWDLSITSSFYASHPGTSTLTTPQVASFFSNPNVVSLNPNLFESTETTIDGINVKALRMIHFNNFGLDFSGVQNLAFIIEMGGLKILHMGDADYTIQNLDPFNLIGENISVVILPAATIKITQQNIDLVRTKINPAHIIAAHVEFNMTESQVKSVWGQDVTVFTQSLQSVRY